MKTGKLVRTIEYVVPTVGDEGLTFRLEILEDSLRSSRRYWLRLYRLEFLRFRARTGSADGRRWEPADYRCWVMDDNLLDDSNRYGSPRAAEEGFRRALRSQIGPARRRHP